MLELLTYYILGGALFAQHFLNRYIQARSMLSGSVPDWVYATFGVILTLFWPVVLIILTVQALRGIRIQVNRGG